MASSRLVAQNHLGIFDGIKCTFFGINLVSQKRIGTKACDVHDGIT
jgi:hypothetical protein